MLATSGPDETQLWDLSDPPWPKLTSHVPTGAASLAFSGTGILATMGTDGTTRLWQGTQLLAKIPPGTANLAIGGTRVAFSPDSRSLALSDHSTVLVLDVSNPRKPKKQAILLGHETQVQALAFSPDGRTIATAGDHHAIRIWDIDTDRLATEICRTAYPRLTPADWARYFPGLDQALPCA